MASADVNRDGNLDLVFLGTDPTTRNWSFSVMLGNGDGTFQSPLNYVQSGPVPISFAIADFNNDHIPDLAFAGGSTDSLAILLGNGDGTFKSPAYYFDNGSLGPLLAADFNHDGNVDIVFNSPGISSGGAGILLGNGDGTFQTAFFPSNMSNLVPLFTADFNNDGKPDLLTRQNVGTATDQVALGNGDGTFTLLPPFVPSGEFFYQVNAIGDLNGDGILDLLGTAGYDHPEVTDILLGNGDGTFGSAIPLMASGVLPYAPVFIADMNGDRRPDIVFPWQNYQGLCGGGSNCAGIPPAMAVMINTTAPGFKLMASAPSPSPVTAGNSATSTVAITPTFGFNSAVNFSCAGLPSGASCTFNPPSIANSSGNSALTITTSASLAAGTYAVQVQGTSGSMVNTAAMSLVVQAAPDFSVNPASGSPTSQTINAGQTATFSLAFTSIGSFTGKVNLSCVVTPVVTPAPTCSLSSGSVQITSSSTQTVAVKVGTTAPVTTGASPHLTFPIGPMPLIWSLIFLGSVWLWARNRKRLPIFATPIVVLAFVFTVGCGGSGSSSTRTTTPGTPAGTYMTTVRATSGSTSHNIALQVVVQ